MGGVRLDVVPLDAELLDVELIGSPRGVPPFAIHRREGATSVAGSKVTSRMPSQEDRTPEHSYTAGGAAYSRNVRTRRRRVDRPGVGGIAPDGLRPGLRRVRSPPRRSVRGRVRGSSVGGPR